jgi:hypothetical protein
MRTRQFQINRALDNTTTLPTPEIIKNKTANTCTTNLPAELNEESSK